MRLVPGHRQGVGRAALVCATVGLAVIVAAPTALAASAKTTLVSKNTAGVPARGESGHPSLSATGRYIAFMSKASNLVAGDTNGKPDCFVRDHVANTTERISVSSGEAQSNGTCEGPSISDNGNFVVWDDDGSNLVAGDGNGEFDIFVRDRAAGTTERVSVSSGGAEADNASRDPMISGDGRYIVFESWASNLVAGDTNGKIDIFVRDRIAGTTERVSVRSGGVQAKGGHSRDPEISANGRFVVFTSGATNLVPGDTNKLVDIFIHDRQTGKTSLISKSSTGARTKGGSSRNPDVSADGRYVVFDSAARNLVRGDTNRAPDVFMRDRKLNRTIRISVRTGGRQGNGASVDPVISANGRRVAFASVARNLVRGDTNGVEDVFMRNLGTGKTTRLSLRNDGKQARGGSSDDPAFASTGRFLVFESEATNLYFKDTNRNEDVFRRGPLY